METKTNPTQLTENSNETKKTPANDLKKPKPEKDEKKHLIDMKPLQCFQGTVKEWLSNKDFIYDGFILETENEEIKIKFPPHSAKLIRTAVENHPEISLKGVVHNSPEKVKTVHLINFQSEGNTVDIVPPAHPPVPDTMIRKEGKVTDYQHDSKNNICGYFINDTYLLKIPPHIAEKLKEQMQIDVRVEFTGMAKSDKEGEVKVKDYIIINTQTLAVNTNEYLIK
ncbi:hypothetical protein O2K51_00675 [Apibacter raozihei]|uniref:hypothetical protein n=1 Tax=Apibacter raozihei TaxID=2500547 RepID=UPI000FE3A526|nr:hypothetical protein [Apibacter raozihei]